MSQHYDILPIGGELPVPPIGFTYRKQTYIPTDERVGSGWPAEGVAYFLTRRPRPRTSYLVPFDIREMFDMKRYGEETQAKRGKWVGSKDPLVAKRPNINQLMTDTQWDDGKPRQPCSLKVRLIEDGCSIVLSDEQRRMSITTTGDTLESVLDILEDALAGDKVRWKPWGDFDKRKR